MTFFLPFVLCLLTISLIARCNEILQRTASASDPRIADSDYERIKELCEKWPLVRGIRLGAEIEGNNNEPFMTYSVSSGGHWVLEKLFVDKSNEMTRVYKPMTDNSCWNITAA